VVLTGADRPDWGADWRPPYDWGQGHRPREIAVRARLEALKNQFPPTVPAPVAVGLEAQPPFGVAESVLPGLAALLHQAERSALIRHLQHTSARSKARRIASQIGRQARHFWNQRRTPDNTHDRTPVKTS